MVGKSTLVPAGSAIGKRGRVAGFYCEACDLTYKDNVQHIEHLNSRQHLVNTGQSGEVVRATLQDVRDRLEILKQRKRERGRRQEDG
jgi:U4/U6.U5 tri-snRNP component SNU23